MPVAGLRHAARRGTSGFRVVPPSGSSLSRRPAFWERDQARDREPSGTSARGSSFSAGRRPVVMHSQMRRRDDLEDIRHHTFDRLLETDPARQRLDRRIDSQLGALRGSRRDSQDRGRCRLPSAGPDFVWALKYFLPSLSIFSPGTMCSGG